MGEEGKYRNEWPLCVSLSQFDSLVSSLFHLFRLFHQSICTICPSISKHVPTNKLT